MKSKNHFPYKEMKPIPYICYLLSSAMVGLFLGVLAFCPVGCSKHSGHKHRSFAHMYIGRHDNEVYVQDNGSWYYYTMPDTSSTSSSDRVPYTTASSGSTMKLPSGGTWVKAANPPEEPEEVAEEVEVTNEQPGTQEVTETEATSETAASDASDASGGDASGDGGGGDGGGDGGGGGD
jgi:uncharacterized membrane protein YgcG